jgi:hypothetical protein
MGADDGVDAMESQAWSCAYNAALTVQESVVPPITRRMHDTSAVDVAYKHTTMCDGLREQTKVASILPSRQRKML